MILTKISTYFHLTSSQVSKGQQVLTRQFILASNAVGEMLRTICLHWLM